MPSGPLYYGPLVDAYAKSVPVAKVAASDRVAAQYNFGFVEPQPGAPRQIEPRGAAAQLIKDDTVRAGVEKTFGGLHALHGARKGAAAIDQIKLAQDAAGYIANRAVTLVDNHTDQLEYADLDQAAAQGAKFAELAQDELKSGTLARYSGSTIDLGPQMSKLLEKAWRGKEPVTADEAVTFGAHMARELERAVTPLPPEGQHRTIQWIEDATIDTLALWPGNAIATAKAAGLSADPKQMAAIETKYREQTLRGPGSDPHRSLAGLLGLAGVDIDRAEHRARAVQLLQDAGLEQVPMALAQGIAEHRKLPADKVEWLAGRIVDVGGRPGNVGGIVAELDRLPRSG